MDDSDTPNPKKRPTVTILIPEGSSSDVGDRNATSSSTTSANAPASGHELEVQTQDRTRPRLTQPNLHQYVTVPVSDLKPKKAFTEINATGGGGRQRTSSQASLPALHVFLSQLPRSGRKGELERLEEIIPDPSQQPRYVENLKNSVVHLIFAVLVFVSFLLGLANYAYKFLKLSHSKVTIMDMYEPQRGFGGIWEFVGLSLGACIYAFLITRYPDPSSWHVSELKCKRLTRWIFYFIMVFYLFVILICWCTEMPARNAYSLMMTPTMGHDSHVDIWSETQQHFLCCGVEGPTDWGPENGTFPMGCCDQRKYNCTLEPSYEEIFKKGCGHTQYMIASTVLGVTLFFGKCIFIITLVMFYRLFVLEVLVLKVERVESSTFQALDMEPGLQPIPEPTSEEPNPN